MHWVHYINLLVYFTGVYKVAFPHPLGGNRIKLLGKKGRGRGRREGERGKGMEREEGKEKGSEWGEE